MSATSKIEWTDASWNPIRARYHIPGTDAGFDRIGWHCEHVSEACRYCYAESFNRRLGTRRDFKPAELAGGVELFLDEDMLMAPLKWQKPRRIFVGSMTDLFADFVKIEWLDEIFKIITVAPHIFQLLTKRPRRMRDYFLAKGCPSNVWAGVSVEDQKTADERIPLLLETPATIRFLSCEPLLGPVRILDVMHGREIIKPLVGLTWYPTPPDWPTQGITAKSGPMIHWIIAGGESGPNARPTHPDWIRALRDQCAANTMPHRRNGVPFFFKQWGEWKPEIDRDLDDPDWRGNYGRAYHDNKNFRILNLAGGFGFHGERVHLMKRHGKAAAGNHLDGVQHLASPDA